MPQSVATVQKDLKGSACPCCSARDSLEAILRCDLGEKDCVVTIHCQKCSLTFELLDEAPSATVGVTSIQNARNCPCCGSRTTNHSLLCEVGTRKCHYTASACNDCLAKDDRDSRETALAAA